MNMIIETPIQQKLLHSVEHIPVEYFSWGNYPDHFKIDMPHRHDFSELIFISNGGGVHEMDYDDYVMHSYSVHYIPKGKVHFMKRTKKLDGFTIAFDTSYLENNPIHRMITPFSYEVFALEVESAQYERIISITDILKQQIFGEEGYYKKKCFLNSVELLLNTIMTHKHTANEASIKDDDTLRKFKYLVKSNLREHCDVAWYAGQLSISTKSLNRHVQNKLKVTPKDYIVTSLIKDVKRTLLDTTKNIKEIVSDYCYSSSQLHNQFKSRVGYTMSEYRSYKD